MGLKLRIWQVRVEVLVLLYRSVSDEFDKIALRRAELLYLPLKQEELLKELLFVRLLLW